MGEISTDKGEGMRQGTPYFFSTAVCEDGGRIRDLNTGVEWESLDAWHKERAGRAATLTYSFPYQRPDQVAGGAA